ncbi:MAG: glycosyltransferase family 39 protein [Limnobacter sp.]|nr:glycosyltransferase family 39 protein [Limnobacter sp.]
MTVNKAKTVFGWTVLVALIAKLWLATFFPVTSDEAFFHEWANHLSLGYYDHPPMVGWWLWALTQSSHSPLVIRSLTVLLSTVVAYGIVLLARSVMQGDDEPKAWLAGAVYAAMPVSWYGVFVTTDTPLVFFMGLAVFAYVRTVHSGRVGGVLLAGVFLGLAFLSKYFAVLLGLAFVLHAFSQKKRWLYVLALTLGALPFVGVNLWYNAHNCWNNVMFNLVNRHDDAQLGWGTVLAFLGLMLYLLGPWVWWGFVKHYKGWRGYASLSAAFWVPMLCFLLIALEKTVGLHWVLGFLPALFVLLAVSVPLRSLRRYWVLNLCWSVPHLVLLASLVYLPASTIGDGLQAAGVPAEKAESFVEDVRFHRQMPAILKALTTDQQGPFLLATTGYSPGALMGYHLGKIVPVFGPGKYHARNDDVFVDWRKHAGKHIRM